MRELSERYAVSLYMVRQAVVYKKECNDRCRQDRIQQTKPR